MPSHSASRYCLVLVAAILLPMTVPAVALAQGGAPPVATRPAAPRLAFAEVLSRIAELRFMQDRERVQKAVPFRAEQAPRLNEIFVQLDQEMAAFQEKHRDDLEALLQTQLEIQRTVAVAGGDTNPDLLQAKLQRFEPYFNEILLASQRHRNALMELLDRGQRLALEAAYVKDRLDQLGLRHTKLTDAQHKDLAGACEDAAIKLMALGEERTTVKVNAIIDEVIRTCRDKILTAEQRQALGFPWISLNELMQRKDPKK